MTTHNNFSFTEFFSWGQRDQIITATGLLPQNEIENAVSDLQNIPSEFLQYLPLVKFHHISTYL